MKKDFYVVVENAGYEGQNELPKMFTTAERAWNYAERWYRAGEIESLHVQVARVTNEGYEY